MFEKRGFQRQRGRGNFQQQSQQNNQQQETATRKIENQANFKYTRMELFNLFRQNKDCQVFSQDIQNDVQIFSQEVLMPCHTDGQEFNQQLDEAFYAQASWQKGQRKNEGKKEEVPEWFENDQPNAKDKIDQLFQDIQQEEQINSKPPENALTEDQFLKKQAKEEEKLEKQDKQEKKEQPDIQPKQEKQERQQKKQQHQENKEKQDKQPKEEKQEKQQKQVKREKQEKQQKSHKQQKQDKEEKGKTQSIQIVLETGKVKNMPEHLKSNIVSTQQNEEEFGNIDVKLEERLKNFQQDEDAFFILDQKDPDKVVHHEEEVEAPEWDEAGRIENQG